MDKLLVCPGPGGAAWMVTLLMELKRSFRRPRFAPRQPRDL
jgi:hypothetical protein